MSDSTDRSFPPFVLSCPTPLTAGASRITLAHGEGGRQMRRLVQERIVKRLAGSNRGASPPSTTGILARLADAAQLPRPAGLIAYTTDSFVVTPLFFPGGDIGELAVYGTVNDLAVSGAVPRWMTLSLIIEEGLSLDILDRVLDSVARAASLANVEIVSGDTKVVPRGAADGLFVNTSGIGDLIEPIPVGPHSLEPGDVLLVSGPIGRHGLAILAARENLGFEPAPTSDCAPLTDVMAALRAGGVTIRAARDATRGGVAAVCQEWAEASGHTLTLEERLLPTTPEVRGACELLGVDPLFLANEGTLVVAVPARFAERALAAMRAVANSAGATRLGTVVPRGIAAVTVRGLLGSERPLDEPQGGMLPRIC